MKNLFFILFSCLIISANAQIILMPDIPIQIDFYHPSGYKDSIIVGLSLNADDGYDEGLDVIDTSALEFPLDVRIYDPLVQQQIGGLAHNLKHSYLSLPNVPRGEVFKHNKVFQVIVASDNINNITGSPLPDGEPQNDCETLSQGIGSTYFKANITDTEFLRTYEFYNTEGWADGYSFVFSDNVFFNANYDDFDAGITEVDCVSINSENIGTSYAYLTFSIELVNRLVSFPVSVSANQPNFQVQITHNHLSIQNSLYISNIHLYNLNGLLLFSDVNNNSYLYQRILPCLNTAQYYILTLTDKNQHILYNHKFFIP